MSPLSLPPNLIVRGARHRRPMLAGATAVVGLISVLGWSHRASAAGPLTESTASLAARYDSAALASDGFARTGAALGRADLGGAWTVAGSPGVAADVSTTAAGSGAAVLSVPKGNELFAGLPVSAQNADVRLSFVMPSLPGSGFSAYYVGVTLRDQGNGAGGYQYQVNDVIRPGGAMSINIQRYLNGSPQATLAEVSAPGVAAGQTVDLEASVVSDNHEADLQARTWVDGTTTPAGQVSVADDSATAVAAAGSVGFTEYSSAANPTVLPVDVTHFDAFALTPAVGTGQNAGALPIGQARYVVPSNAVYVATTGSDTSGSGALAAPFASVKAALARVPAGGTIVVRGGDYNQYTFIGSADNGVTIENYPGEAVWFDGSVPVTGWTPSGSTWVHSGWNYTFDSSASFTSGSSAGGFLNPSYPLAANPDQVFVDGRALTQVAGSPVAGQFAVNYSAHTITVGTDPTGHAVRASNQTQAFVLAAGDVTLRGIGVENYATPLPAMGTIFQGGSIGHETFENMVVENNATIGIGTSQPGNVFNHDTVDANGYSGLELDGSGTGVDADGMIVENSKIDGNNTQNFNPGPACAGIKIDRVLSGITVVNNQVENNNANGIWTDENVTDFTIVGNTVTGNGSNGYGIINELSDTGVVADNTISGSKYGYTAFDSGHVKVFNNQITGNTIWGIGLTQDNRYQPGKNTAGPNVLPSAADPWLVQGITADDNVLDASSAFQFYALDKQTNRPATSMGIDLEGNLFQTGASVMVGWGGADDVTVSQYRTPAALQSALGVSWNNAAVSPSLDWPTAEAYATIGVPAPADVSTDITAATGALGAGSAHVGLY